MEPKFIVRHPHILSTPREVARALGTRTIIPRFGKETRWETSFFMGYPPPNVVIGNIREYAELWHFFQDNKRNQRTLMALGGLPVPVDALHANVLPGQPLGRRAIVRPLRHQGGAHYRITDILDWNPAVEYASFVFPKTHEYRIIYVFGNPVIFMKKIPHEGISNEDAWNHGNSTFRTIPRDDWARSNLRTWTSCFQRLGEFHVIRNADYVGADVLYNRRTHEYVICELNSCPAIQIEENLAEVIRAIRAG